MTSHILKFETYNNIHLKSKAFADIFYDDITKEFDDQKTQFLLHIGLSFEQDIKEFTYPLN